MRDWLVEIIDQIALGECLAANTLSCGQRFGLIAVDNAVEFMLIAYVEGHRQLVGGHKVGGISRKDWDTTKSSFPALLAFVGSLEARLASVESEVCRYHDFRNSLYHSGIPITTSAPRVRKYSKLARDVLDILFSIRLSTDEWAGTLAEVSNCLCSGKPTSQGIKREVVYEEVEGVVRFLCAVSPIAREAIALAIHGFATRTAAPPDRQQLAKCLAVSGHTLAPDVTKARIAELRRLGWLQKEHLLLTAKGRKALFEKYIIR